MRKGKTVGYIKFVGSSILTCKSLANPVSVNGGFDIGKTVSYNK